MKLHKSPAYFRTRRPELHARALREAGWYANADLGGVWVADPKRCRYRHVKTILVVDRFYDALHHLCEELIEDDLFRTATELGVVVDQDEWPGLWRVVSCDDEKYDLRQFGIQDNDLLVCEPYGPVLVWRAK